MSRIIKKIIFSKQKGQALLIVLVIGTLTLMLLLGLANRIISSQYNIRRSTESVHATAASENSINEIANLLSTGSGGQGCMTDLVPGEGFKKQNCNITQDNVEVFAKLPTDNTVQVFPYSPSVLLHANFNKTLPNSGSDRTTGVKVTCPNVPGSAPNDMSNKFEVTRVFFSKSGSYYKIDKATSDCAKVNSNNSDSGNLDFYNSDGAKVDYSNIPFGAGNADILQGVVIRALDIEGVSVTSTPRSYGLEIKSCNQFNVCTTTDSTSRIDVLLVGTGGLGSDNMVQFSIPTGQTKNTYVGYDLGYFGENLSTY